MPKNAKYVSKVSKGHWIALRCGQADLGFIVVENIFCSFFTVELILRYMLFLRTWYALQDPWFMFLATRRLLLKEVFDSVGFRGWASCFSLTKLPRYLGWK